MSKSLTESAAEILKVSLGSAGKEPMKAAPESPQDLGGQTPTTEPEAIGSKVSASAKEAPKPGQAGAPAEPMKKSGSTPKTVADEETYSKDAVAEEAIVEETEELTEEELDEYLNSLTEEELNELMNELEIVDEAKKDEEDDEDDEEDDEDDEDSGQDDEDEDTEMKKEEVEQVDEMGSVQPLADKAPKKMPKHGKPKMAEETETEEAVEEIQTESIKDIVAKNMGSCKEDIDALFNGEALSEEFRGKATVIFEAAVRSRVEAIVENIVKENDEKISAEIAAIEETFTDQVDSYLNYVVEEWIEENKLAVETGLRTEIAEDFINSLKTLFTEHYIEVPAEKADIFDEMAEKLNSSEEKINEQTKQIAEITKKLNESMSQEILRAVCDGLTEVQTQKIKALAEGVEFTTEGDYKQKLEVLRENYFPSGNKVKAEAPASFVETDEPKPTNNVMDYYVNAITKTLPK